MPRSWAGRDSASNEPVGGARTGFRSALRRSTWGSVAQIAEHARDRLKLDDRLGMNLTIAIVGVVFESGTLAVLRSTFGLALFRGEPSKVHWTPLAAIGQSAPALADQRELLIVPAALNHQY
jgi:hypothetical protein